MANETVAVPLPEDLIAEIDEEVGVDKRSTFLLETARAELRRRKLQAFLSSDEPVWKDEDHPELAEMGTIAWVRELRKDRPALKALDAELDTEEAK